MCFYFLAQTPPLSQTSIADYVNIFLNAGVGGLVIWWFMQRMTPAITDLARAIDRMGRILVTLTLSVAQNLAHCAAVEEQCQGYIKELDDAASKRDNKSTS